LKHYANNHINATLCIKMHILVILLGCNIAHLLTDRIQTAVHFAHQLNGTRVDWFLSGGKKHPSMRGPTEAEQMARRVQSHAPADGSWRYIHDTRSTNTADNFWMAQQYLQQCAYDRVVVVTSAFHYPRARLMSNLLLSNTVPQWVLGSANCEDCDYWEQIHVRNVATDVATTVRRWNAS